MTRTRFINAMQRAQGRYSLDRISIGAVRVSGNIAVADTELFGRITTPFPAEGKIVVQQYLVREERQVACGYWRQRNDSAISESEPGICPKVSDSPAEDLREAG